MFNWIIKLLKKEGLCKVNTQYELAKHRIHTTKYHDLCM